LRLSKISEEKMNHSVNDIRGGLGKNDELDQFNLSQINVAIDESYIHEKNKELNFKGGSSD
jgi:hypothetical protein